MTVKLVWKTDTLENIDEIDFKGDKLYMKIWKVSDIIYHCIYVGKNSTMLRDRVRETMMYGDAIAKLHDAEQLVSCTRVLRNGIVVDKKTLKEIEDILIKELDTEQEQLTKKLLKYYEIESTGDIPELHNFEMKWNETMKSDRYFGLPDFVSRKYVTERY